MRENYFLIHGSFGSSYASGYREFPELLKYIEEGENK